MTRLPFDPAELGTDDSALQPVADALERYADQTSGLPPSDLAARIRGAIGAEPVPGGGWLAALLPPAGRSWGRGLGFAAVGLVAASAVVVAIVGGQLMDAYREANTGSSASPVPTSSPSPSLTPSPTLSPSPTPMPSESESPSPSTSPSASPEATDEATPFALPSPSESEDEGGGADHSGPGSGEETPGPSAGGSGDGD
ncbi:MAG: hypothetical protein ACRDGJ_06670 [Candidatus Limnocylindria bacterium]